MNLKKNAVQAHVVLWQQRCNFRVTTSRKLTFLIPNVIGRRADIDMENVKVKGKAIPLQAFTGPEGSRRLRLPDFKTIGT
jgi:hypothetical protein